MKETPQAEVTRGPVLGGSLGSAFSGRVMIDCGGDYKPGDLPPEGYLQWTEWAEVQRKAGIKQVACGICSLWKTPQELSGRTISMQAKTAGGQEVTLEYPVCSKCDEPNQ